MFPGHQDKSYGNLFDVVSAPDVSMNGQQLNKWLPDEFECPIHKPLFGVGKDLQLLLCGEHHMPSVLHPNICLKESCFNEVLCKLQNYITIIYQYLRGLIIGIQTLQLGFSFYLKVQVFGLLRSEFLAMPVCHSAEKSRVGSTGLWLS